MHMRLDTTVLTYANFIVLTAGDKDKIFPGEISRDLLEKEEGKNENKASKYLTTSIVLGGELSSLRGIATFPNIPKPSAWRRTEPKTLGLHNPIWHDLKSSGRRALAAREHWKSSVGIPSSPKPGRRVVNVPAVEDRRSIFDLLA
ncbi:hypothetical protein RRG08_064615 [Elysia crispata]|uniref:Uncharacterized protein n=1 Tax=Elysia crispata TaxID=231223 RepID=A0AAE1EC27_9GAST|nr:hypothetical protein RRG08_064615 [Elysia crispata]